MQEFQLICPQCQNSLTEQMQFCPLCGYNLLIHKNAARKQEELNKKMAELDEAIEKEKKGNQFQKFLRSPVICYSNQLDLKIKFASLPRRAIAYFIDDIILYSIAFLIITLFISPPEWPWSVNLLAYTESELMNFQMDWDIYLTFVLMLKFLLALGYFMLLEARPPGQSLGKKLVHIQLYDINNESFPNKQLVFVHALGKAFEFGLLLELLIPRQTPTFPLFNQDYSPITKNMIRMSQRMTNIVVIQK